MARTYTDIPEPRKVLEADTIRGYSRETVEEALAGGGGGGGYDPNEPDKLMIILSPVELMTILGGTATTKQANFYDKTKFQPYMTVAVTTDPATEIILYATSYVDDETARSITFVTGSYLDATNKTYFITATCTDADTASFSIKAIDLG